MIKDKDIILYFNEEAHRYTDQFSNKYTSSTTLIHKYVTPFNTAYWSKKKAIEAGVSQQAIKDQWKFLTDHACDKGNGKHNTIENGIKQNSKFKNAIKLRSNIDSEEMFTMSTLLADEALVELNIDTFYNSIGTIYPDIYKAIFHFVEQGYHIYAEVGVFSFEHLVSGMVDCLLIKDDTFIILDWKTNKNNIKFTSGYYKKDKATGEFTDVWVPNSKFMQYPLDHLDDCNGIHYTLQLSLYARLIERFGLTCKGLFLAHIRDQFELNQWGMPKKDPNTKLYIPIEGTTESVAWHPIKYHKQSIDILLNYHYINNNIEASRLTQTTLYDNTK